MDDRKAGGFLRFVPTVSTQVTGAHKDKHVRVRETVRDLQLACEGAFALSRQDGERSAFQWIAPLARACSVFLRKMVLGDQGKPSTRLLDDDVIGAMGISFAWIRRIPPERRVLEMGFSIQGGAVNIRKIDEGTGLPEATVDMPIAPHELKLTVEWPLPGAAGWTEVPIPGRRWRIAPEELFGLESGGTPDCSTWLGQQLVMFDGRGITLKDVISMVATFEGAHSINVSRLMQPADERPKAHVRRPERHILDNIMIFGMKYTHIVVIEAAFHLYEMLVEAGHAEKLQEGGWRFRPSFGTVDDPGPFFEEHGWLGFSGGLIAGYGGSKLGCRHRIRAVR